MNIENINSKNYILEIEDSLKGKLNIGESLLFKAVIISIEEQKYKVVDNSLLIYISIFSLYLKINASLNGNKILIREIDVL